MRGDCVKAAIVAIVKQRLIKIRSIIVFDIYWFAKIGEKSRQEEEKYKFLAMRENSTGDILQPAWRNIR